MPLYVVLYRFTDQGRKNIKETVDRAQDIRERNESLGFTILGHYWTQGQYDLVSIVEAPTEASIMAGLFAISEAGNVPSETLRAFTDEQIRELIGSPFRE